MYKTLILLFIISSSLLAQYKIGMPKNPVSKTFDNLIIKMKKHNLLKKNNISIIRIDMKQKDFLSLRKEIENVDLFFITGSYFNLYFNKIQAQTDTLVIGNKKASGIKEFDKNKLLGIYRQSAMSNIFDILNEIDKNNNSTGILVKENSIFHKHRVSKLIKLAKKNKINLIPLAYKNNNDLENIFKENSHKLNSIQLWPASVDKKTMKIISKLQYKYKIPLVAQRMSHIKHGAALGYILDYEKTFEELIDFINKLSKGIKINELKSKNAHHLHVVNLNSVSKLNLSLSENFIKNSKIISNSLKKHKKSTFLKKGNFTIAMPDFKHELYDKYIQELQVLGYVENKNLEIIRFNTSSNIKLPARTDFVFTMGNFLDTALKIRDNKPLGLFSLYDFKDPKHNLKNIFHLNIMENDIINNIKYAFPQIKNITVIGNKKARMPYLSKKMVSKLSIEGHNVNSFLFKNINELENLIKIMNNKKDMILLFPASLRNKDLKKLIQLQEKYKILIVSQLKSEVKKGLAFAISTDINISANVLANATNQILMGLSPLECVVPSLDLKFFINLNSVYKMNFQVNKKVLEKAEVITE